ncbi:MAG: hypothetical protein JO307_27805 [Bryobacterales bacterium]|nr:hypothetical protein [Bryobacterales bacterium]MBV9400914.1 hypothetical protein [Bryobacterales bacterium]
MKSWLFRYAVFVALCVFVAIICGAWETSVRGAPGAADTTVNGLHFAAGIGAAVLMLGLSIWMAVAGFRALGGLALILTVMDYVCGMTLAPVSHAICAQLVLAVAAASAVCTSSDWRRGPELVYDAGWPSLRSLAVITPVLVLAQVILGAAFRHKVAGLTWHIVGAMVVSLSVLLLGMFVMQQFPKHSALRLPAIALLTIVVVQVLLGIAAITAEMMAPDNTTPNSVMLTTAAHVAVGSLTLAASVVLSIQIRRNVLKPVEEPEQGQTVGQA